MAYDTAARWGFKMVEEAKGEAKGEEVKDERNGVGEKRDEEASGKKGEEVGEKKGEDGDKDKGEDRDKGEDKDQGEGVTGGEGAENAEDVADVGAAAEGVEALAVTEGASIFGGPTSN